MNFLQDAQGNNSSMRLMLVVAFVVSILTAALVIVGAWMDKPLVVTAGTTLVFIFIGVATTGKALQSFSEKAPPKEGE